ncbi:hypothetical protein [uncultured Victivallis sp.]|mgnify:CR=1 FL=1|uniref:hypothetical protein n=1 Tax=uncultured Victivallis sp. TaxID=354118 RepID=UPI00259491C6|nr:hypothetical protein [uncultured Victivallis sp.]
MKTNDLRWQAFGFPQPGFLPARLPAEGLRKALEERRLPFRNKWDIETIAQTDYLPMFAASGDGQTWCREFDRELREVAKRYFNHTKLDFDDQTEWADIMWTWDELLLEAAEGDKKAIADPEKGDLSPEWNLIWAIQRMRAINLLLYAPVQYMCDYISGSVHTGEPSSPAAAAEAALKDARPASDGSFAASYVHNIYGPDHGWREGSYCCNATVTKRIYAEFPEGLNPDGNVYLFMKVAGAGGSDENFFGSGVSIGLNRFTADADGVFVEFGNDDFTAGITTPTKDHETFNGWEATHCTAFADYAGLFHFKEGDAI